ncbi:sugar efflux transporter [Robbsia sp. Bb-Pol-6]|uniref:Sugar efflux transporter n=1 Tax=Robbsia betulipollinis TaxID=2981849 RepID=A0ABT3ZJV7_9BURK|nr:sugar efflux transporter [Robbsia betulipollinis]MCY0386253.1 sugar efflux transporter [Robbsia betulipollinis]
MNSRFASLTRIPSFLPLAGATLMLGIAMSFTAPYLSLFSIEHAGMTPLRLGFFMTLIAASGVVASTWAGKWSDRHGHHRELLLAALGAAAAGFLCLCFVTDYLALLAIGVLFLGAGGSALSLVFSFGRAALVVRNEAERAFATATLRTVLSVAWVFGPSVGALILAATNFYGLFLFAALGFLGCAVVVWRMPRTRRAAPATASPAAGRSAASPSSAPEEAWSASDAGLAASDAPSRLRLWRTVLALTLLGLAANATMIVLPLYIVRGLGGTRIDVSIMLGLGALLEIPMMLALGARGATLNKVRWLAACAAVHVVYFIAVAAVSRISWLIPMQALSAFVVAVTSCLGMTYVQDLLPRSPGAATALFFNAARVGSILSGVLSGVLVGALGYRGTFLVYGVLPAVGLWLFLDPPWRSDYVTRFFPRRRE